MDDTGVEPQDKRKDGSASSMKRGRDVFQFKNELTETLNMEERISAKELQLHLSHELTCWFVPP